jgi:hypothetical protein
MWTAPIRVVGLANPRRSAVQTGKTIVFGETAPRPASPCPARDLYVECQVWSAASAISAPVPACRLTRAYVDVQANVLTVRQTKFSKFRIVTIDPTSARALRDEENVTTILTPISHLTPRKAKAFTRAQARYTRQEYRKRRSRHQRPPIRMRIQSGLRIRFAVDRWKLEDRAVPNE